MRLAIAKQFYLAAVLATGIVVSTATPLRAQTTETKKSPKKPEGASLTGCVDQQDGQFVLVDDHDLKVIATLDADGFPEEGFAKHVGHKVTVRGINTPGATRAVFKVRTVETVSDNCEPTAPGDKK